MQIDTGRLEYVAASIHTFWDGIFQVKVLFTERAAVDYSILTIFYEPDP